MIVFNRLNGKTVAINPDLIERVEETPDTVITLVDDKKFLVAESLEQVIALITDYRAYVIARSTDLMVVDEGRPTLHVVPNEDIIAHDDDYAPSLADVVMAADYGKGNRDDDNDTDGPMGIVDFLPDTEISRWTR